MTSGSPLHPSVADSAAVGSILSSKVVLTNTALLNMSFVWPTSVTLPHEQTIQAGSAIAMWFVSWPGAQASVYVMGPAYKDVAGNVGKRDMAIQVSVATMR
jgi:hypothetical protein